MSSPDFSRAVAAEHTRELRLAACRAGLAALARRCEPSVWSAAVRRSADAIARLRGGSHRDTPACSCA